MMKKAERMDAYVDSLAIDPAGAHHPCYQGFFTCFNRGEYYEAHDVLEHLWLRDRGPDHLFYKGLIQIAGAFVHLRKQYLRPDHPTDGRRLRPAVRLFRLGLGNIEGYGERHLGLDLPAVREMCEGLVAAIVEGNFRENPWTPAQAPQLTLNG